MRNSKARQRGKQRPSLARRANPGLTCIAASGRTVFLAGQVGWNAEQHFDSANFVAQVRQALENIVTLLAEAGGKPEHITRLTWYVTSKQEYLASLGNLGAAYRGVMGKHFPTMTLVQVVALVEDQPIV